MDVLSCFTNVGSVDLSPDFTDVAGSVDVSPDFMDSGGSTDV